MKKKSIVLLICLITSITLYAQEQKIFEIKYAVTQDDNTEEVDTENPIFTVLSNQKYASFLTQPADGMYKYIVDKEVESTYTLLVDDNKNYLELEYNYEILESMDFDFRSSQTNTIAGYTCKKATIKILSEDEESENYTITVWYTEQIPSFCFNEFIYLKNIPGAALKIHVDNYTIEAYEINKTTQPLSIFQIPEDYTEMEIDTAVGYNELGDNRFYYEDETGEFFGLKDAEENIITPAIYASLSHFNEGVAIVTNSEGKYGSIDIDGKEIIAAEYDYLYYESTENQYIFIKNEKYGLIKDNKIIIPAKYDNLSFLINGYAIFSKEEMYGLIDKNNRIIVPAKFNNIVENSAEFFTVEKNQKYSLYRIADSKLIASDYDFISLATDSELISVQKNAKYGFVNKEGKVIIPFKYVYATSFTEGQAYVAEQEDMEDLHMIDIKGNRID